MIEAIRHDAGSIGGVEEFLREHGFSTKEGLVRSLLP
jgi:RHH-type transcriptional regulator, proline utilization regulon repressor / proline dehydrogenase / delta 1-pyrroline-5-carboxylate dehydrogenase